VDALAVDLGVEHLVVEEGRGGGLDRDRQVLDD